MLAAIADTHTAIWYLFSDPRLGRAASDCIEATIASGDHIGISAISLAEMIYLIGKKRVLANALEDVLAATAQFYGVPVLSRDGRIRSSAIKTVW